MEAVLRKFAVFVSEGEKKVDHFHAITSYAQLYLVRQCRTSSLVDST